MIAAFVIVPNLSAYLQFNRGYPRERLGLLYLVGGACGFVCTRLAGRLTDQFGAPLVSLLGTAFFVLVLYAGFLPEPPLLAPLPMFVAFMVTGTFRNIAFSAVTSRVPFAGERARFMSSQSAVQHLSAALGAFLGAELLRELPSGALVGIPRVVFVSIALGSTMPLLIALLEARLRRRPMGVAQARTDSAPTASEPVVV